MRIIQLLAGLLLCMSSFSQTQSRLIPKKGWFVTTQGLTWTAGSELNFFSADKKQHHYYFTWWEQDADSSVNGKDILQIGSSNTAVNGTYALETAGRQMQTKIDCRWNLKESGLVDIAYVKLWMPFFREAEWYINGRLQRIEDLAAFHDTALEVKTAFGRFRLRAANPFRIKRNDNPNPAADAFESRAQFLICYEENIHVNPNDTLRRSFTIEEITTAAVSKQTKSSLSITPALIQNAWEPTLPTQQVLPLPKSVQLQKDFYILTNQTTYAPSPASEAFQALLKQQWQIGNQLYPNIITIKDDLIPEEGYTLEIGATQIVLKHRSAAGLQHALYTLLQLTQNKEGKLMIPCGIISDAPSIGWRGIHMFTGPTSWALHRRMYERVLLPLKMNKVVLQCEQAEWKSFPNIHNNISIPLADLKNEFAFLRSKQTEPIPLIQSLGHMEWFFKPMENRFMAVNPQYPYTLNPELPASRKAVKKIWDEAFKLLKPSVMHIGFDEIGMIGFHEPRSKEIDYWKKQIDFLHRYAQKKKAKLMLWGDMGLAPGEGPDALNGVTKERAALLRSTIPAGSYIADWHYINNPNPEVYKKNLLIWKENKNIPLASPWLRPDNVRGFVLAAKEEGAGVLQTTWADFESSEKNMLLNIEQFGAYILALDYAWSGRNELPKNLPYNAIEEWTTRFYSIPKPIEKRAGMIIPVNMPMRNISRAAYYEAPDTLAIQLPELNASGMRIKATTDNILQEGTPVARIQMYDGKTLIATYDLRYGAEIRSSEDQRSIFAHIPGKEKKTHYHFFEKQSKITEIKIQLLHAGSGLKIDELIVIE